MDDRSIIMNADSLERIPAEGEGLDNNFHNMMPSIDEGLPEHGAGTYQNQKAISQKEFVSSKRRAPRSRDYNHNRLTSSLRSSLRRTNAPQPRKKTFDNLHRTDNQSDVVEENNNLDGSDSSRSNNSGSHYIQHMKSFMRMPFSRRDIPETTPENEVPVVPDSEVERIVQRLEERHANRVSIPPEVKVVFLRMCLNVCRLRNTDSDVDCGCGEVAITTDSPCISRDDVINMRNKVRLEVELRSRSRRIIDTIKTFCGFMCHSKVLLNVLNRAVDTIDSSGHKKARERRRSHVSTDTSNSENEGRVCTRKSLDDEEWFYYKDFAFYSLKVESEYPWIRSHVLYSILVTFSFYLMSPILWCEILRDDNVCPASDDGLHNDWLSPLYFASVTMSTVGYGDLTVLGDEDYVENWRLLIAIIFMIFSLLVSVVGLQAGLDSQFNPFRRRIDIFLNRVYEIINEKKDMDKHDQITMRMKWSKFAELTEVILIFFFLNLFGVFALRISLAFDSETETMSWMESFYWAVQTTTTVGYGDVKTPHSFRWFLLFYLAVSTYFVGNAIGKLKDLSERLDSMQRLCLWQQQEASYEMLNDFSGRMDHTTTEDGQIIDIEPEIDQFEFCIASLVLMGKVTSEDVRVINDKFKQLTKTNKITSADVPGPTRKEDSGLKTDQENLQSSEEIIQDGASPWRSQTSSVVSVGKKIAIAFKEEVLGSNHNGDEPDLLDADDKTSDFKDFGIPNNTYAIGIDDSQIQRKLMEKYFAAIGIPRDHCSIIGNGRHEIMGFVDYTVQFMENHGHSFVFLIVDENLDVVKDDGTPLTVSGSVCVENIRKRLTPHLERRLFALIRSANDSSSDIALYRARAHGFLAKAPIKKGGALEALAPLWLQRFPPSEFEYSSERSSRPEKTICDGVSCSPLDIDQKLNEIDQLFEAEWSEANVHLIKDSMHEFKGDLLTLNASISIAPMVGLMDLIIATKSYATMFEKWHVLRGKVTDTLSTLEKNFKLPPNTIGIAIDDSQIQRKLLGRFFSNAGIPPDRQIVHGEIDEILGFENFVVQYVNEHVGDFIFILVDENLDIENRDGSKRKSISGSHCVEKIRKRLSKEAEKRIFALVRSANDSTSDVSLYNIRCHGFLPKAPLRKEKINETLAPLWYKRFPPSEFGLCLGTDQEVKFSSSEDVACSSADILQKLNEIDLLFDIDTHISDPSRINDVMHELKGDLLTMTGFTVSMIGILGQINLMLQTSLEPDEVVLKWQALKNRTREAIQVLNAPQDTNPRARRSSVVQMIKSRPTILSSSLTRDS